MEKLLGEIRDGIAKLVAFTVRGYSTRYTEEFGFNASVAAGGSLVVQRRTRRKFLVRNIIVSITALVNPGAASNTDVDIDATQNGAAGAISATLAALAGVTTFITGFEVTGSGATAGSVINVSVTGILGGTKIYTLVVPTGVAVSITPLIVEFTRPIPASGLNIAIVVNVPSFGAGNTNAAVTAHGFQRTANPAVVAPSGTILLGSNLNAGGGDSKQFDVPVGVTSIPCSLMLVAGDDRSVIISGAAAKVSMILSGEEIIEGAGSPPTSPQGDTFGAPSA